MIRSVWFIGIMYNPTVGVKLQKSLGGRWFLPLILFFILVLIWSKIDSIPKNSIQGCLEVPGKFLQLGTGGGDIISPRKVALFCYPRIY